MKEKAYQSKPLLTKREREVFELLVQDKTTKEIAGELFISEKTVRNHISNDMCSICKGIRKLRKRRKIVKK
ncbi:helix-turn-helix domain-containing protein [Bacillus cereus]|uniref:helix-turn-helix domain-containing protein n=1 Tax=Bacillus cereus TaxID=1396 RepID=UPI000B4B6910|nr:LuxR C-terminal-related transcriptional regulator [Bacillus cereus]